MILQKTDLEIIYEQAQAEYPEECCGIIIGLKDDASADEVFMCANVQNQLHQENPEKFPRDARTAYNIDPRQIFKVHKEAREKGLLIKVIYHSHVDAGVYFSDEDRKQAFMAGERRYPDASYLIVSLIDGKVRGSSVFTWHPEREDFDEVALALDNS